MPSVTIVGPVKIAVEKRANSYILLGYKELKPIELVKKEYKIVLWKK